jgi:hypothetical protein
VNGQRDRMSVRSLADFKPWLDTSAMGIVAEKERRA